MILPSPLDTKSLGKFRKLPNNEFQLRDPDNDLMHVLSSKSRPRLVEVAAPCHGFGTTILQASEVGCGTFCWPRVSRSSLPAQFQPQHLADGFPSSPAAERAAIPEELPLPTWVHLGSCLCKVSVSTQGALTGNASQGLRESELVFKECCCFSKPGHPVACCDSAAC